MFPEGHPIHVLSKRSKEQGRDLFLWDHSIPGTFSLTLAGGINTRRFPYLTCATLYRWIRLICNDYAPFKLRAIRVREAPQAFLAYTEEEETLYTLDEESNDKPPPGDYAAFCRVTPIDYVPQEDGDTYSGEEGKIFQLYAFHSRGWSGLLGALSEAPTLEGVWNSYSRTAHLNVMPPAVEDFVREKYNLCNITGSGESKEELGVVWIFPPGEARLVKGKLPQDFDMEAFVTSDNAILLRNDLIKPFHENIFGVDVDDNYRIVQFDEYHGLQLPSHVPDYQTHQFNACTQIFLRQHFRWCLLVQICGGHILDDYNRGEILQTMNELGMGFDDDVEEPPMEDPRWQTEIGKICFRMRLYSRMAESRHLFL
ncbi:hypothetical protein SISNIDRAFT_487830 [Sistotremastrum niveocremeum HHB9708]|uniref:Uncharacterized protein n=1 Tax=Sistotremastrum niveocremeum HHB9708 TaxID=1314777 RepID=A0A164S462_9AGAM|nr:hypothetical protein SISNIDRAFT_487830 [Sistotremastrum niveocremeum HHB9708]